MYPIKTYEKDNTIVKVCVEDIYKVINFIKHSRDLVYSSIYSYIDEMYNDKYDGYYIESKGKAQCTDGDSFDSEIGNEIAFRKVKLYANIKKCNLIDKVINLYYKEITKLKQYRSRLYNYIDQDIEAIRQYNPKYCPEL